MTDDELFALPTRIHRIESSMITFRASLADEALFQQILAEMYADLVQLRSQLDTALGQPKPSTSLSSAPMIAE